MSAVPAFTEESTSRLVRVRAGDLDLQLHYNDIGTGDQVVVMLHGSGPGASGWSNFNRNIEPLVARGYRVLLMDCPGWSKSDSILLDKGSRAELNARSLKGFLDALKIDKAHLVGNSMGAHSVVMFTLMFPERAGKIIMMGGGTGGPSPFSPGPLEGIKLIQRLYRNPTVENVHRMMEVFVYDTSNLTEALFKSRLDNMMARQDHLENFWKSFDINPRQYADVGHRLGEIKSPALIIWGRDDRFVPVDIGLRMLANMNDARMHIFARCGHWAQWEHADEFNRLLANFLDN